MTSSTLLGGLVRETSETVAALALLRYEFVFTFAQNIFVESIAGVKLSS